MTAAILEKTPQQTIERLAKRKKGFTSVELAKERGKPGNHCGPFVRSIKAAITKGTIIATAAKRNGKVVYQKNPNAPKKKRKGVKRKTTKVVRAPAAKPVAKKPAAKKKSAVARKRSPQRKLVKDRTPTMRDSTPASVGETFKALGGNPNAANLLGDFFESLAGICRGLA